MCARRRCVRYVIADSDWWHGLGSPGSGHGVFGAAPGLPGEAGWPCQCMARVIAVPGAQIAVCVSLVIVYMFISTTHGTTQLCNIRNQRA